MSKGLDLIKRQEAELIDGYPTGNVYIGLAQGELNELEKELKEHEQYKAIEKEIGIDLITLLKVQTMGAYFKGKDKKWIPMTDYNEKCFKLSETEIYRFYFKDYGKTWALTKEELL